ncbi:hypothetical protein [Actinomycetospora lutea]|uniref:hypothetical protein n=1 Tax=Actinomycetospora lutea TaxID=663604 RepID=UPI003B680DB6
MRRGWGSSGSAAASTAATISSSVAPALAGWNTASTTSARIVSISPVRPAAWARAASAFTRRVTLTPPGSGRSIAEMFTVPASVQRARTRRWRRCLR